MQTAINISFLLALLLHATCEGSAQEQQHVRPRIPLNSRCPHHGYPFTDRGYAQYVAQHPLMQPGVAARMVVEDPVWYTKSLTEFAFTTAKYAADYLSKIQPIDGERPFKFKLDCSSPKYKEVLSGSPRAAPVPVVWGSRLNYETPLLLYRLHVYKDLVDYQFISETERIDHSQTPKPLMLELVKSHIMEFLPQIVHHVVDGTNYGRPFNWTDATLGTQITWQHEGMHFGSMQAPFLKAFSKLPDDTIVLHGDIDETPDEDFLFHLKRCELKPGVRLPIRSNSVQWLYDYRYVFKSNYDTSNPFSFRFPLFWTLGFIRQQPKMDWRNSPASSPRPSLPGGVHFNNMLFAPSFYMKMVSVAEGGSRSFFGVQHAPNVHNELQHRRSAAFHWGSAWVTHPKCLVDRYPEYKDVALRVPWLLAQNVQQFAFFIPCEPAFYDRDNKLETDYGNCSRLFSAG